MLVQILNRIGIVGSSIEIPNESHISSTYVGLITDCTRYITVRVTYASHLTAEDNS